MFATMNKTLSKPRMMSNRMAAPALDNVCSLQTSGINFCGYLRTESGVGAAARGYIRALRSAGLPLALLDISDLQTNRSHDHSLNGFHADFPHDVSLVCADVELHYAILTHLGDEFFRN